MKQKKSRATVYQTAGQLRKRYGYWGEHPEWPTSDWVYEVRNDDTRQGYWEWVSSKT